jgi:hypothetical protein
MSRVCATDKRVMTSVKKWGLNGWKRPMNESSRWLIKDYLTWKLRLAGNKKVS